ncbi:hypothetical protein SCOR_12260 [Sulfidibacter corallicola]|uniref:Patatin-like phospholipase n=1 Tax=Sulfidibacter corallicola TaxID=2818388 RepID=A0A8A4TD86_SULCO|nr:hypothetical protein [Sulfidibacter corallicola]QTD47896.1 hypothetical protein J3U87_20110 [Sulfidibacter corallicola]
MTTSPLKIQAGRAALQLIRKHGFDPNLVQVVPGAAGGPKWLMLNRLDRALFGNWFKGRNGAPLHLIGSSIGSWRFTALSHPDPIEGLDRFEAAYLGVKLIPYADSRQVSEATRSALDDFLPDKTIDAILNHPTLRLHIVTARARGMASMEPTLLQGIGMMGAFVTNAIHRELVGLAFERVVFQDKRSEQPFYHTGFRAPVTVALDAGNLKDALMASAAIPLVLRGVRNIAGAPAGTYRDGGLLDYQFDIPYPGVREGIVLFPHYTQTITPGWLDKSLKWRRPRTRNLENMVMISPSPEFVAKLPMGKIPDRHDFEHFRVRNHDRIAYWRKVLTETDRLHDTFLEWVEKDTVLDHIQPFET